MRAWDSWLFGLLLWQPTYVSGRCTLKFNTISAQVRWFVRSPAGTVGPADDPFVDRLAAHQDGAVDMGLVGSR